MSRRIQIGVIRGGTGAERERSLRTGAAVIAAIAHGLEERYDAIDVVIGPDALWSVDGQRMAPEEAIRRFDIAWNALHGAYGGNGSLQSFFEAHGVPLTGSASLPSALGLNRSLTKRILKDAGIRSPYWKEIPSSEVLESSAKAADALFASFLFPAAIKPAQSAPMIGVAIVREKKDIAPALEEAARHGDTIIIEEFIPGDEASCAVIDDFRGQDLYALPPVSDDAAPAKFPLETNRELERIAKAAHEALGLKNYSRAEFIVHPRRGIYLLRVDTLPDMSPDAHMPRSLRAVGSDIHELIDHIVRGELGV